MKVVFRLAETMTAAGVAGCVQINGDGDGRSVQIDGDDDGGGR